MIYLLIGSFHTHSHIFPGNTQPEFPQPISITSPLMVWFLLVLGGNMVKLGSDPFALPLAVHAAVIRQLMLERGATLLYLCWSCLQILFLRLHLVWADCPSSLCASLQPGILWLGLQGSVLAPWDLRLQGRGQWENTMITGYFLWKKSSDFQRGCIYFCVTANGTSSF